MAVVLRAVLTCPDCGAQTEEAMPTDACRIQYECLSCGFVLRPRPGDDCVFCSFADTPCPPVQEARAREQAGTRE